MIGDVVGPASTFSTGYGGSTSHFPGFTSGTRGILGFSVRLTDATLAYGWAEVTFQNDNTPGMIHGWAYDSSGAAVGVTAIPEPTSSLILGCGLFIFILSYRARSDTS
jgi:hypothetical protein